jgi:hypothetical protein
MTGYYRRDGQYVTTSPTAAGPVPRRVRSSGVVFLPSNRRRNGCGITPELPTWRTWGWNLALVALETVLACWGHVVAGLAWTTIALELAAVAGFGVALMTYVIRVHVPRTIRRHQAQLQVQLQAHLTATTLAAEERRHQAVDRQSTPHPTKPSTVALTTVRVSRAR